MYLNHFSHLYGKKQTTKTHNNKGKDSAFENKQIEVTKVISNDHSVAKINGGLNK